MTPEEFDHVYVEIARALGEAQDQTLFRDRLILLLAQRMDVAAALDAIAAARLPTPVTDLKSPATTDVSQLPHS